MTGGELHSQRCFLERFERQKQAAARLIADIQKRQWHLSTGFVGTRDLMAALSKIGRNDVVRLAKPVENGRPLPAVAGDPMDENDHIASASTAAAAESGGATVHAYRRELRHDRYGSASAGTLCSRSHWSVFTAGLVCCARDGDLSPSDDHPDKG